MALFLPVCTSCAAPAALATPQITRLHILYTFALSSPFAEYAVVLYILYFSLTGVFTSRLPTHT